MPRIREEKPKSLPDYLKLVEKIQTNAIERNWYRGCGARSHTLIPSLYRHQQAKTPDALADLEGKLMTRFRQRSLPYLTRPLGDEWEALFFMQHYGIPTRLLDWTENPLTALHFALMSARRNKAANGRVSFLEPACVWVLDPVAWNRHALEHQSYDGGPLVPGDEALKGYKPALTFAGMNKHPVAVYGSHNSPRIVAQQGVFTIFGQRTAPMEKAYVEGKFPADSLIRITINRSVVGAMRESLLSHGVTESVVYPDLHGLALEIKRSYGFEE